MAIRLSAGTVVAGAIALLLGAVGLLELYGHTVVPVNLAIVSAYLTTDGALLLFGAIAVVGIGLMVGGLVSLGDEEAPVTEVQKEVVVVQPVPSSAAYEALSELELSILRSLSQGRSEEEIAASTGVAPSIVSEKVAKLQSMGYITDKHALTERGFEALRLQDVGRVYVKSTA